MASIVLIDDDDDMRETMADLLSIEGHEVRTARNGVEGLQALDDRFPQLVLTDVEMPVLDGCAMVYRMFVENLGRENVPVIVISGAADLGLIARALGTPYYLVKPFPLEKLTATIDRALTEAIPARPPSLLG
ncbi:MAG TPA: response regulator [Polyangia bacterium]|jgi:DNA-binding NtrC family response regulator|nr:response regulator [Polyangia bacterium]